jgi:hypothetical protein
MNNKPSHYIVDVFENDFPKHPSELDVMSQIRLPDGVLIQTRVTEDITDYISADKTLITDFIANSISCKLLAAIQKDLQSKIAEMIWERFKGYDLKSI